jgi:hypothetical protein
LDDVTIPIGESDRLFKQFAARYEAPAFEAADPFRPGRRLSHPVQDFAGLSPEVGRICNPPGLAATLSRISPA